PLQPDRLHCEEIDRERAPPMRTPELAPGHPSARAGGSETHGPQPVAHRCRRDRHAEAFQFADDALVPPPRVVSRETDDQLADLTADWTPPDSMRVPPTLRHQAPMPTKQRRGRDDEGSPAYPRQEPTRRREEEPVGPRHGW